MFPLDEQFYRETKKVKLGLATFPNQFRSLASWIADEFGVEKPLNILFEKDVTPAFARRHRLTIVFEWKEDADAFRETDGLNFDRQKLGRIIDRFCSGNDRIRHDRDSIFAITTDFSRAARFEANRNITKRVADEILREIGSPEIWKVLPMFESATVFFFSDNQLKRSVGRPIRKTCRNAYAQALQKFDQFDYFAARPIEMKFDSRETFKRDYNGSWFAYTR